MKNKNKYAEYFGHIIKEIWINNQLYIVVHDNMRDLFALILVTDEVTVSKQNSDDEYNIELSTDEVEVVSE